MNFRSITCCTALALTLTSLPAQTADPRDKVIPPIDFERWGRFIVQDFFDVQPYERVVYIADLSYYPELLDAIRAEMLEAKAIEVGTILFDGRLMQARRRSVMPRTNDAEYRDRATRALRKLFADADIYLWLPYRYGTGSEPGDWRLLEHLIEGLDIRGLHFHWLQRAGRMSQADVDAFVRLYEEALDIDYAALSAHQQRGIELMRGKTLHVTTPLGTDFTVEVREDSWFHKGDGRMDLARASQARAVRDLEMELPSGALRFVPDVTTVEGRLVVPEWGGGQGVTFEFRDGRIVSVTAREGQEKVTAAWESEEGDKDRLAEMVLGFNPKLGAVGPGGRLPYYGYGAGILRVSLGDNWESGGDNSSSLEAWFYIADATVVAGDTVLVEEGRLLVP